MSRSDDVRAMRAEAGGIAALTDLTPIPLTATGPGEWVRCTGRAGFIHVELSDSTTPAATVKVEASNSKDTTSAVTIAELDSISGAKAGCGCVLFAGPLWVRLNVTAISGAGASVTGTVSWS